MALAKMQKMEPAVIAALRNGTEIPDRKLEALHRFTTLVVRSRGWVSDADTDAFLAAGYTQRNVLEVILGVATKVMSNYTNHVAHTQLDQFMRGNEAAAQTFLMMLVFNRAAAKKREVADGFYASVCTNRLPCRSVVRRASDTRPRSKGCLAFAAVP
jgi:hypothetical protein